MSDAFLQTSLIFKFKLIIQLFVRTKISMLKVVN